MTDEKRHSHRECLWHYKHYSEFSASAAASTRSSGGRRGVFRLSGTGNLTVEEYIARGIDAQAVRFDVIGRAGLHRHGFEATLH